MLSATHRVCVIAFLAAVALTVAASHAAAAEPEVLDVWPAGAVPGEPGSDLSPGRPRDDPPKVASRSITLITDVTKPTLTLYRAPKDNNTGTAVVVCPGGGYHVLAWDHEGTEVAEWLNSVGVTAVILRYRVPVRQGRPRHELPLMDIQRAVSLVRSKAGEWGVDPQRIGVLGFSAGGNLSALACTNHQRRTYEAKDDVDKVSCRPDFGVLIYPAWLVEEDESKKQPVEPLKLKAEFPVDEKTPPMFLAHAHDDPIRVESSVAMYLALKKANVPADLHVYATGGHGFGLRQTESPSTTWPKRCEEWMRSQGLLKGEKAAEPKK